MGPSSTLGSLLFFLSLYGLSKGFVQENCTNYRLQFERVYSVPGDVAMLNSTLVSPDVFNFTGVPYNMTWYNSKTGQEMSNQTGRILLYGETLWFLNVTPDDNGEYVCLLRTPSQCYMQATMLVVDKLVAGECGRPRKTYQPLTHGVSDNLNCPLKDYIDKLDSYNVTYSLTWYRGCEPILEETSRYIFRDKTKLMIHSVDSEDNQSHTCTLTFSLGGFTGKVSETIIATVTEEYSMVPQIREPDGEIVKAHEGSEIRKRCLVFIPGVGTPFVDVVWFNGDNIIERIPGRINVTETRSWPHNSTRKGMFIEVLLQISEVRKQDFNTTFTCLVFSGRGCPQKSFTLQPADPDIILPIVTVHGGVMVLFIISVSIYYIFKIDIVLCFRRTFPVFYLNKDMDGKLYDAYVAYPQPYTFGFSERVESFALHTLPQVLEKACDYKLFLEGRDCLPGQAMVDSVEENLQASRRLILLYTASTFIKQRHTSSTSSNNNNVSKNNETHTTSETGGSISSDGDDKIYPDAKHHFVCVEAMHRALIEGSLKVVLVELEEITPAQLALFPESVRHLRKKQGAVCWWKNLRTSQSRRTCLRREDDVEKAGNDSQSSPSLSPSSRFWKELRYHMPVRGKRVLYPEKTALLHL
ncbi:interleukin-1 receptor type 1 [Mugil cephalus]|uniref:interleukin-1 receptor type 1 n=1 Tax=Mugil cephalus TaxID=48193 RepID=UPI001FB5CACB|nr:interleukin-1 receptor type 1 [Mugil cephalus]XP_047457304.1 interleukin-1 receptor type 1 [Mugil cephalus]XP_047457305.1 interleukin-1 receptor type 1 [Mugil cephalus]XP_047457306.1 interleukin-1 receptor type 1 [Mugil cephalus]